MERKKLIEVALPLEVINDASAYDKMPGIGAHPKGMHHWWAALPLPCARAILFASLVDDPSSNPIFANKSEEEIRQERQRLFSIIRDLCDKKSSSNPSVFRKARAEILNSCGNDLPNLLDPFSGGGSIALEGMRLGLPVFASDLNPVAVLKSKATIEIPPKFSGRSPTNPKARREKEFLDSEWTGVQGLCEDIRFYGEWVRKNMESRIGNLYPKAKQADGKEVEVFTWLWARTVKCKNPACGATTPLVRSFWLTKKSGKNVWVDPLINEDKKGVHFTVRNLTGNPPDGTINRNGGKCICCGQPVPFEHIRAEGKAGRIGNQLMAIVAENTKGRQYLSPSKEQSEVVSHLIQSDEPNTDLPEKALGFRVQLYGMTKHRELFTPRQLIGLLTLCKLTREVREVAYNDAITAGMKNDGIRLVDGGDGASAYADAIATYLAFAINRLADFNCSLSTWKPSGEQQMHLFVRQAVPMVWDFAEANILGKKGITWKNEVDIIADSLNSILIDGEKAGQVKQLDASSSGWNIQNVMLSTDPPYYDNIGYADLSDFFYVWLRQSIGQIYPDLFSTILTPKKAELVATPFRFDGDMVKASEHFENGFRNTFTSLSAKLDSRFPITVYYAFKQAESDSDDSDDEGQPTAWETMLESLLKSGFQVTSTWPVRASQKWRMVSMGTNSLASYIVFSCRLREKTAPLGTRRELIMDLKRELPSALKKLQEGSVAPVDYAQAAIGPGMSIFSRYSKIVETDGSQMPVRTALQLINQELDAYLRKEEGDMDGETQLIVDWFEQFGMSQGPFGDAELLSKAKNTKIDGLARMGILTSKGGKVSITPRDMYPSDWDPVSDPKITLWQCTQNLIKKYLENGESAAASLFNQLGVGRSEEAKNLAYRLYNICEKKGWADEAKAYNDLVVAWSEIQRNAAGISGERPQKTLDMGIGEE